MKEEKVSRTWTCRHRPMQMITKVMAKNLLVTSSRLHNLPDDKKAKKLVGGTRHQKRSVPIGRHHPDRL